MGTDLQPSTGCCIIGYTENLIEGRGTILREYFVVNWVHNLFKPLVQNKGD